MRAWLFIGLWVAAPAYAQDAPPESPTKTRFYDFNELELEGGKVRPTIMFTDAKKRAQFETLFTLARSFLPELRRSAAGAVVTSPGAAP